MNHETRIAYEFLYKNANPIIKYEAGKALGIDVYDIKKEVLKHPKVQYWLECIQNFIDKPQVHNSADTCLENWMHKLMSFGINEEDDNRLASVNSIIAKYLEKNKGNTLFYNTINETIAASWLACMGRDEQIVIDILRERVEAVYEFTIKRDYNIYVETDNYPTIPKARAHYPLVNPSLYKGNVWKLPTVHDIFAFYNLPQVLKDDELISSKIDNIIEYILDERYQQFHRGYGIMLVIPNKYYAMGWSVHLDHYKEYNNRLSMDGVIWAMELMSHFEVARKSDWFNKTLKSLEQYKEDSLYEFPASYISEGKNTYYVGGGHMGLGENRRKKLSRKIESTAWMMRILSNQILLGG